TESTEVVVYSGIGKVILSESLLARQGSITLDGSMMPPGMYFISVKSNTMYSTLKIVKR
ncbi:T9SS type A sorting domain-containing protein, partial [uncultured Eudoraea sp.]|uniref:T9SS type A sorting domain-containing protein n=1 Tax=uncultured Eudoraea sp. TaxID=1035614 RepID=UPI003457EDBE